MQYSFVAAEDEAAGAADEAPMFFAKGNLIVVPDEMWPADFRDRDLVMSAEGRPSGRTFHPASVA